MARTALFHTCAAPVVGSLEQAERQGEVPEPKGYSTCDYGNVAI